MSSERLNFDLNGVQHALSSLESMHRTPEIQALSLPLPVSAAWPMEATVYALCGLSLAIVIADHPFVLDTGMPTCTACLCRQLGIRQYPWGKTLAVPT